MIAPNRIDVPHRTNHRQPSFFGHPAAEPADVRPLGPDDDGVHWFTVPAGMVLMVTPLSMVCRHDRNRDRVPDVEARYGVRYDDVDGNGRIDGGDRFGVEQPAVSPVRKPRAGVMVWCEADTLADAVDIAAAILKNATHESVLG